LRTKREAGEEEEEKEIDLLLFFFFVNHLLLLLLLMICPVCRGTSFHEAENGFFICNICHTQSQDLKEQSQFEAGWDNVRAVRPRKRLSSINPSSLASIANLKPYLFGFQLILKEQCTFLIKNGGCSPYLFEVCKNFFLLYLQRLDPPQDQLKLLLADSIEAMKNALRFLYLNTKAGRRKRAKFARGDGTQKEGEREGWIKTDDGEILGLKREDGMNKELDDDFFDALMESDDDEGDSYDDDDDKEEEEENEELQRRRARRSEKEPEDETQREEEEKEMKGRKKEKLKKQKKGEKKGRRKGIGYGLRRGLPRVHVALALCYISCVHLREPILIVDLIRWARDGQLPFLSANLKLPKDIAFRKYLRSAVSLQPPYTSLLSLSLSLSLLLTLSFLSLSLSLSHTLTHYLLISHSLTSLHFPSPFLSHILSPASLFVLLFACLFFVFPPLLFLMLPLRLSFHFIYLLLPVSLLL
jgi:hypothetical protein